MLDRSRIRGDHSGHIVDVELVLVLMLVGHVIIVGGVVIINVVIRRRSKAREGR